MKSKFYILSLIAVFCINHLSAQVNLNYFNGSQTSSNIELAWQSASEINLNYYSVERSIDSINYSDIQIVTALGNTSAPNNYSFLDTYSFSDTCYYYRLKATQLDGSYSYSDTIKVCFNSQFNSVNNHFLQTSINIYPNPVNNILNIDIPIIDIYSLNIYNQLGQIMLTLDEVSNKLTIDCSRFDKGIYYLQFYGITGVTFAMKFIRE